MPPKRVRSKSRHDATIDALRNIVKSKAIVNCAAFLAENDVCEAIGESGLAFARAPESGATDGVFICTADGKPVYFDTTEVDGISPYSPEESDRPSALWDPDQLWTWIECIGKDRSSPYRVVPFDVKHHSLMAGGLKKIDYAYHNMSLSSHITRDAEIYLLVSEDEPRYFGVVPAAIGNSSTDVAYGIQPLLSRVPVWCHGLMVRRNHLGLAIEFILAVKDGAWYVNPSNGVTLTGWMPQKRRHAPIWPSGQRMASSLAALRKLWRELRVRGCRVHANPIAPMWCDFLADFLRDVEAARVEHKILADNASFETGKRSPFAPGRQWHVLICTVPGKRHFCFLRHEIFEAWSLTSKLAPAVLAAHTFPDSPQGIDAMVSHIQENFRAAIAKVDDIIRHPPATGYDIETIISSGSQRLNSLVDPAALQTGVERLHHARGLWWLGPGLNKRFCEAGKGLVVSMDFGHGLCSSAIISYDWTEAEQQAFRSGQGLPATAYSTECQDMATVPLQLVDFSVGAKGTHSFPIYMRQAYWLKPVNKQPFLIIGSTTKAKYAENSPFASYAVIPSEVTTMHQQGLRAPYKPDSPGDQRYFRRDVLQEDDALPNPPFKTTSTEVKPLKQGSAFFSDASFNPLRYIFSEEDLFDFLLELISGEPDEIMTLQNPQSRVPGIRIRKGDYRAALRSFHQVSYDYGLTRKPESAPGWDSDSSDDSA